MTNPTTLSHRIETAEARSRELAADILDHAADLIEPEGRWTQGWSARAERGGFTFALSPIAVCWCAGGAIIKANGADDDVAGEAFATLRALIACDVGKWNDACDVGKWNDAPERTQAEVVTKLREAAARARASQEEPKP